MAYGFSDRCAFAVGHDDVEILDYLEVFAAGMGMDHDPQD
jgi:hypothetical protein